MTIDLDRFDVPPGTLLAAAHRRSARPGMAAASSAAGPGTAGQAARPRRAAEDPELVTVVAGYGLGLCNPTWREPIAGRIPRVARAGALAATAVRVPAQPANL
jgi:hypothetical protein